MNVRLGSIGLCLAGLASSCVFVPNPNHDGVAEGDSGSETAAATESGSGDGDPGDGDPGDGDPGDGDPGDGDPGDGDPGDGDPGDGDGDTGCELGEDGCPCTVLETCNDGLACVLDLCVPADSCAPVNDNVAVSASPSYIGGDPPPPPPDMPVSFICSLSGVDQGNSATLNVSCGGMNLLQSLTITVQPKVSPIEDLIGNLAATVTIVELPEGLFVKLDANGMQLYYVNGSSLFAPGLTDYPWFVEPFSSSCGKTPTMCGEVERLAMFIDGGVVFDGNAGQASDTATAWIETNLDVCGTKEYELVLLAY